MERKPDTQHYVRQIHLPGFLVRVRGRLAEYIRHAHRARRTICLLDCSSRRPHPDTLVRSPQEVTDFNGQESACEANPSRDPAITKWFGTARQVGQSPP